MGKRPTNLTFEHQSAASRARWAKVNKADRRQFMIDILTGKITKNEPAGTFSATPAETPDGAGSGD